MAFFYDDGIRYEAGDVSIGKAHKGIDIDGCNYDDDDPCPSVILLPHQCDDWVIGSPDDARWMIQDLEAAIRTLEEKGRR